MSFALETASHPENLKRIAIDPVSRVEGHGKVTILLDDNNHVHQVRLHIVEFRGFERFIQGRPYWEVPVVVQRLCGICPVSHHLAGSKALDWVVGAPQISPTAEKMRRLMHFGQVLQSHAVHFFHLASPDLLFGFDAEVGKRNILNVAAEYPDIARQGVLLRKYGQEVIRLTAGKKVHGISSVPGGIHKSLNKEEIAFLKQDIGQMIDWSVGAVELCKRLYYSNLPLYENFARCESNLLSLVRPDGALELYDGLLRARDSKRKIIFDKVDNRDYHKVITEEVKSWSYMKFPHITALGREIGWYKVGPLARVQNCDFIDTPLAEEMRQQFMDTAKPVNHATLAYHWARMIEVVHCAEKIRDMLDDPDLQGNDLLRQGKRASEGIGIIEAPRGTLFHHYHVGDDDLVTMCNLIVSTTSNNQPMNEAIRSVAREYLDGERVTEGLLNHIEVAIRAYDPCLSCATHALGQMPLQVELVNTDGTVIDTRTRGADFI
ncbi:MAG: Ni/Fe hydrogenase subunit alpha [Betaproteobacteria bacterium]|nr:Ni/Fe hydrogenase subunit alpha [Betaproteobacteria bacterium]